MAVTVSLTLTNAQAQRVASDVGGILGLGRDATVVEVRDWLWSLGKSQCMNWERQQALAAVVDPVDLGNTN
jgi:hypothetical protein